VPKRKKDGRKATFLIRDVDPELWARVKSAAALNHETVTAAIHRFLQEYAKKGDRHAAR
jgi:hypothetical protein